MKYLLLLLLLCIATFTARSQKEVTQGWYEADVYYRISSNTRLYGLFEIDRDLLVGSNTLNLGAFVDVGVKPYLRSMWRDVDSAYTVNPLQHLVVRTGVMYVTALNSSQPTAEWRAVVDLTPRWNLPWGLRLNWRNRSEFRYLNEEFSYRFRTRPWLERQFHVAGTHYLTPYISSEIFFDTRFDRFSRAMSQIGVSYSFVYWSSLDILTVYQRDWITSGETTLALQIAVAFYF